MQSYQSDDSCFPVYLSLKLSFEVDSSIQDMFFFVKEVVQIINRSSHPGVSTPKTRSLVPYICISNIYKTGYVNYTENSYGRVATITDEKYRKALVSWQIPAIKKHFGDLTDKPFIE